MPDPGVGVNVMGPQPISARRLPPDSLFDAGARIFAMLIGGDKSGLLAMTEQQARDETAALADAVKRGAYTDGKIIGTARAANHYYIKARLTGENIEPFKLQVRLGENEGRWTIREALNLTGRRSGWSK
ncbi:MAG TPA: hypothetical protein VEC38_12760 [Candidatus Binataceae bacterium]|nr:hypothetical protein [Candidatus Binataceae bacterium]